MSGKRSQFAPLPSETGHAARSIYHMENIYLIIGDRQDQIFGEINLDELDPTSSYPLSMVSQYALVTIFQFAEGLPDRMAAEMTRTRMDWKYALHLPLSFPGLQGESLCQFRQRLWLNPKSQAIFEQIIEQSAAIGLISKREISVIKAQTVLLSVCTCTRLDRLVQAFTQALESIAARQPEILRMSALPHWYGRYDRQSLSEPLPQSNGEQVALAKAIGADAQHLLKACSEINNQAQNPMAEILNLQQVFCEQFYFTDDEAEWAGEFYWRSKTCASCTSGRGEPNRPA